MVLIGLRTGALLALLIALPVAAAGLSDEIQAYQYRISWNGIPAARAMVTLNEKAGRAPLMTRLRVEIETNAFVDLFWSLRAESWAEVDAVSLRPSFFEFRRRINGRPEDTWIKAGSDGLLTGRYARPGRYRLIEVADAGVVDPIAAVLHVRRNLPAVGEASVYDVFTGEARYRIVLHRRMPETISVPAGRFNAARIEPTIWRLDRNDRDDRVRGVTFWVTTTPPYTLLRIRSKVFIGAVYVDLTEQTQVRASGDDGHSIAQSHLELEQDAH